jgi:hypothetical protein
MIMARAHSKNRGDFTRKNAKSKSRGGSKEKLPPGQAQALRSLEYGRGSAGREFKERGSEPDRPVFEQRPPTPNESTRSDMDEFGTGG